MFERILVPLDGSELAELALPYAEELAGKLGSEVTLLNVSESAAQPHYHADQVYLQEIAETSAQYAKRHITRPGADVGSVRPEVLTGHPAAEILDYADREDIGLIVMATHGRSGAGRWLLGGVTSKVVRAAKRPVVLVRTTAAPDDLRERGALNRAIVTLDGSKESEAVVPHVVELASRLEAKVILFRAVEQAYHVGDPMAPLQTPFSPEEMGPMVEEAQNNLDRVSGAFKEKGVAAVTEVRIGDAPEEILKLAREVGSDLVAMSTHGRSGLSRWAFGSVAEKVLYAATFPILLVRSAPDDHH